MAIQSDRQAFAEDPSQVVAPRDSLEHQLIRIWEDLLQRRPIGVDEDFFEIGGESVLAMSLLARVAEETSYPLPAGGSLQARTIAKLAELLREGVDPETWSPLVPIQPNGSRAPFYCVHPGGGNVLCYLQLSRRLGEDQPFFGLQAPGVDGICEPLTSVEAMAECYLKAIREHQPHGPYHLGGWSVGGVIAYEMARRLEQAGEEVDALVLFDSGVLYLVAVVMALFPKGSPGMFDFGRQTPAEQLAVFRARSAPAGLVPDRADDALAERILHLFVRNLKAVYAYQPGPYEGCVSVLKAEEPVVRRRFDPYREWSEHCRNVRECTVPGNHLSMVYEPYVAGLAEALEKELAAMSTGRSIHHATLPQKPR